MTNAEILALTKRVEGLEAAFGDVCNALVTIEEHLPKAVLWQPGVREALQVARETCERVASRRNSKPPSAPKIPVGRKL